LKLDAYFNKLKSSGVRPISLLLRMLPRLKLLVLNFDLNSIETEGGQLLGMAIRELTQLRHL
jgi:hypothetical protein